MTSMHRRRFLGSSAALATAATLHTSGQAAPISHPPLCVFAKHVQALEFTELGRRLQDIGVQGIEATLRNGGQIAPPDLPTKLPALCDALAQHGQRVVIAASDVNSVNQASEAYIRTLAKHSIQYFRMAYYRYDFTRPILPQLDRFAATATELAQLCQAHSITALYQNHAGRNYVGAALWDLHQVLSAVQPSQLAVALDIRHTTLELTQSYQAAYAAIRSKLGATYIKDFEWLDGKPQNVPLGQGRAKPLFDLIRSDGFVGPLSLHMEYTDHKDPQQLEPSWQAIREDVATLKQWLSS